MEAYEKQEIIEENMIFKELSAINEKLKLKEYRENN